MLWIPDRSPVIAEDDSYGLIKYVLSKLEEQFQRQKSPPSIKRISSPVILPALPPDKHGSYKSVNETLVNLVPKDAPLHDFPKLATTTSPYRNETQGKWIAAIENIIGNIGHILHISPIGVIALLVFIVVLIISCACICSIRAKNKKVPKNYGTRVDVFDDLEMPDFDQDKTKFGNITYSITYDMVKHVLRVRLLDAAGLHAAGEDQQMDPYVVVKLVKPDIDPDASILQLESVSSTFKTKVRQNTCSPVFNEVFLFKESLSTILSNWLLFNIFDYDMTGSDVNYGYVLIYLNTMDSNAFIGNTIEETAEIIPSSEELKSGDLCVILKFIPQKDNDELEITLLEARDLPLGKRKRARAKGCIFLSVCLYKEGKNKKWKKKLSPRMPADSPHPYFNTTFRFKLPKEYMRTGKMVMKVIYLSPLLGTRETIGRLTFYGGTGIDSPMVHWVEVMKNPFKAIPRWHTLPS